MINNSLPPELVAKHKNNLTNPVSVRLPQHTKVRLEQIAEHTGLTVTAVITIAVDQLIANLDRGE